MSRSWSQSARWVAIVASAGCALVFIVLVGLDVARSTTGIWATVFIFAVGVLAATAALLSKDPLPPGERTASAWLQPKRLSILFLALLGGLGAMSTAKGLFRKDAVPPESPRILAMLPGVWGEEADVSHPSTCPVTYRFAIDDKALTVDSIRYPPGESPYRFVATINLAVGDKMEVTGEQPLKARGRSATFTYAKGGVERLIWDDRSGSVPLKLVRCA